jgi:hypothetical protein
MSTYLLHILSLFAFMYFFPDKVLDFLRTMRVWLDYRQAQREAWNERVAVVTEATVQWLSCVAAVRRTLAAGRSETEKTDCVRQALAAGERYLMAVEPEDDPDIYHQTEEIVDALRRQLQSATEKKGQAVSA